MRRAREGCNTHQAAAASRLGLNRATLNAYESGRANPSESRTWEILDTLALGDPVQGERPALLVSYSLFGQRLLPWEGRLLSFSAIENAQRAADELDDCGLERVVIVPAWPSAVASLLEHARAGLAGPEEICEFETLGSPIEDVLAGSLVEVAREAQENLRSLFERRPTPRPASPSP
jgi:transcriptional regulator with XRE-family HTH domain